MRRRRQSREEDREKLLDAAEELFAERGYYAVSVREIAELAATRLAEINDSFGGKEALFREVIRRRAGVINQDREALLALLPGEGKASASLDAIVDAFARPLLRRAEESSGWSSYLRLVAQLNMARHPELLLVIDQFNPIALRFMAVLKTVYPEASERQVTNAYQFMVSCSMTVFSNNFRSNTLTRGQIASADFAANYQDLRVFLVAGVEGLLGAVGRKS